MRPNWNRCFEWPGSGRLRPPTAYAYRAAIEREQPLPPRLPPPFAFCPATCDYKRCSKMPQYLRTFFSVLLLVSGAAVAQDFRATISGSRHRQFRPRNSATPKSPSPRSRPARPPPSPPTRRATTPCPTCSPSDYDVEVAAEASPARRQDVTLLTAQKLELPSSSKSEWSTRPSPCRHRRDASRPPTPRAASISIPCRPPNTR